jgi:four helix bundle protein
VIEPEKLRQRSKSFAFDVVRVVRTLPPAAEARVVAQQLLRSGMSVAANYRAACRSRSRREFILKIGVIDDEADESMFWLEALSEMGISRNERVPGLLRECNELISIFVASRRTASRHPVANHQSQITNRQSQRDR